MNVENRQSALLTSHISSQERNTGTWEVEVMDCLVDPIRIDTGFVSGTVLGDVGNEVRVYRGIPYAAPPVGDLRWRPPQPAAPWSGIRECTHWSNRSPQTERIPSTRFGELSEDCLYLNVITPAKKTTERFPVMVWFHGGGLTIMSANSPMYTNTALPQHGVVVVTVNQRLGPIGYLAHPLLTEESGINASGNYGQLDAIAALKWVQKNIAAFGGDPNNVTIFGESGGGTKVSHLLVSPLAKGLFHRAMIESGNRLISGDSALPLEEAEKLGEKLAAELGVGGAKGLLPALRALSWQEILSAATKIEYPTQITVDGWSLPDAVQNVFKTGRQNDVPFIMGCNSVERPGIEGMKVCFDVMSTAKSKGYAYVFSHVPARWRREGCVAFHGLELPYVFGFLDALRDRDSTVQRLSRSGGAKGPDPGLDETDEWLAETMMTVWAQFAATGDPCVEGLVIWPAYEAATDLYLDIGHTPQVKSGLSEAWVAPPEWAPPNITTGRMESAVTSS